ncbi:hypothetical protein [Staphylococcus aureus]|uniref:hypothetical protein n=1 Tax=Staphylococcus aureus TaxID=1280 RepID=UPI002892FCFE|nr:hypothetical protein [Staphylococcus aureus]
MDLLEEPDIVKLRDVYGSHRIQLINEIHRIADVEELEIAASSMADSGNMIYQSLHAFNNEDSVIAEAYGSSFLDFYNDVNHDKFNPNDSFIFFSNSDGIFTRSYSQYLDALKQHQSDIINDYILSLVNGNPVTQIPNWFYILNLAILDSEGLDADVM